MDHVGGLAKVAVRHEIGAGPFFSDLEDMVDFLSQKFMEKKDPVYHAKEIDVKQLEVDWADARLKYYRPIKGSNSFQIIVFCPNNTAIRAAEHLCICDQYKNDYGTCDLFTDYTQVVQTLNKMNRHSNYDENEKNEEHVKVPDYFLLLGSVCALAAANKAVDAIWFVQIKWEFESTTSVSDDYGHIVTPGPKYMLGHFLEQVSDQITSKTYKLIDKETIFYRESVV